MDGTKILELHELFDPESPRNFVVCSIDEPFFKLVYNLNAVKSKPIGGLSGFTQHNEYMKKIRMLPSSAKGDSRGEGGGEGGFDGNVSGTERRLHSRQESKTPSDRISKNQSASRREQGALEDGENISADKVKKKKKSKKSKEEHEAEDEDTEKSKKKKKKKKMSSDNLEDEGEGQDDAGKKGIYL